MDDPRSMGIGVSGQGASASVVRELEAAKAQLERELVELRRAYHDDVGQLQGVCVCEGGDRVHGFHLVGLRRKRAREGVPC